jgi:hypothetical protein
MTETYRRKIVLAVVYASDVDGPYKYLQIYTRSILYIKYSISKILSYK